MYRCYLKWFGRFQHPLGWGWVPGWFVDPILWYPRYPQKMPNMAVFRPSRQKKNMFNMDENPSCSMGDTMKYNVIWCYTFMLDFQLVMWKIPDYTKSVEGGHNPWRNQFDRFPPKIRDTCWKKWTSEPSDPACLLEIDRSWSTRFMVGFPAMFTCLKMRHTPQKKSWCMVGYGRLWRSSWWSFCSSASTHLQSHSSNKKHKFLLRHSWPAFYPPTSLKRFWTTDAVKKKQRQMAGAQGASIDPKCCSILVCWKFGSWFEGWTRINGKTRRKVFRKDSKTLHWKWLLKDLVS